MKKVWGLFFISLISAFLIAKENYSVLTDPIIRSYNSCTVQCGLAIKFDEINYTITNEETIRLVTKINNLSQLGQEEPLTDLELQTLIGKIYAEVKMHKDNKYHKIDDGTRCLVEKNGLCNCITVVKRDYLEKLKEEKDSH